MSRLNDLALARMEHFFGFYNLIFHNVSYKINSYFIYIYLQATNTTAETAAMEQPSAHLHPLHRVDFAPAPMTRMFGHQRRPTITVRVIVRTCGVWSQLVIRRSGTRHQHTTHDVSKMQDAGLLDGGLLDGGLLVAGH